MPRLLGRTQVSLFARMRGVVKLPQGSKEQANEQVRASMFIIHLYSSHVGLRSFVHGHGVMHSAHGTEPATIKITCVICVICGRCMGAATLLWAAVDTYGDIQLHRAHGSGSAPEQEQACGCTMQLHLPKVLHAGPG